MSKKHQPAGINMMPSKTELGKFIRERRLELGLRQVPLNQLIPRSGDRNQLVSLIETGKRKFLDPGQVEAMAKALQIDPEELRKHMPEKYVARPRTELGKLVHARREELGMTLENFAKKSKLTLRQAKYLEVRKNPSLRYHLVKPLAKTLKLDVSVFAPFLGHFNKPTSSKLGALIRQRRKELGMSIVELAKKLKVTRQFVDQVEFGQTSLSNNDELVKRLADVLKMDVNQLNALRPRRRLREMASAPSPLSGFLTARRLELRLSQRELGDLAKIHAGVVSGLETGRVSPTPNLINKLATAMECEIPPELIPPPRERKRRRRGPSFIFERTTPLGEFVTKRRLELGLTQAALALKAGYNSIVMVAGIELGTYRAGRNVLERLAKALECEIPSELISSPRKQAVEPAGVWNRGYHDDLDKIKQLAQIKNNSDIVRKAVQLLRRLLEKQADDYIIFFVRDKEMVELEILL